LNANIFLGFDTKEPPLRQSKFIIFCNHTLKCETKSGVQRVVLNLIRALSDSYSCDLVKWDEADGQLRYLSVDDIKTLYRGSRIPSNLNVNILAQRVNYRFGDAIQDVNSTWLIFPEIPFHSSDGNRMYAKILSQSREYGIRVATIFYDLIPVVDQNYRDYRELHEEYLLELLRSDVIVPISRHAGDTLLSYYSDALGKGVLFSEVENKVRPILLGETHINNGSVVAVSDTNFCDQSHVKILMLGTVEPRKQQVRVLRVLTELIAEDTNLPAIEINVVGSLHPLCAEEFNHLCAINHSIKYHSYVDEVRLAEILTNSTFSIFPSYLEGYGLPIVESLAAGVPCLTASFGSMAEVASRGGCLLVDVLDDRALKDSIRQLVVDSKLRIRLRGEIGDRVPRTWENYVYDFYNLCSKLQQSDAIQVKNIGLSSGIVETKRSALQSLVWFESAETTEMGRSCYITGFPTSNRRSGIRFVGVSVEAVDLVDLGFSELSAIADADAIGFASQEALNSFLQQAQAKDINKLVSSQIFVDSETKSRHQRIESILKNVMASSIKNRRYGADEKRIGVMGASLIASRLISAPKLEIVISTYNRGKFVELNVSWILGLLQKLGGRVSLLVVDNASTDDTGERLAKFCGQPYFKYVRHAVNVGMLGNLRESAVLAQGHYVWLIGDDDFIVPGAIERIINVIDKCPRIPIICGNFGVYNRLDITPEDSPTHFISEMQYLAPNPSVDQLTSVNEVAEEHDNLFTAIYPIVFRHDLSSACFNYPFDGKPFSTLVECIPTSKLILGSLRYAPCYWLSQPIIVGNVNNSWARHRPRWHLVIMPLLFQLARSAGVDGRRLFDWARVHLDLFTDAVAIAIKKGVRAHINREVDIPLAEITFLRKIDIPKDLEIEQ